MKINKILVHGILLGVALLLWVIFNHRVSTNSGPAIFMAVMYFTIHGLSILAFYHFGNISGIRKNLYHLLLIGAVGISLLSVVYVINVTLIDKTYIANEIAESYNIWDNLGYSEYQKANQVELSETYSNPFYWSLDIFAFNALIYLAFSISFLSFKFILKLMKEEKIRTQTNLIL